MVVQKFGGTSVADPDAIGRLVQIVSDARARDRRGPAVVVSAMSGVTDALLAIAAGAGSGRQDEALSRVAQLRDRHLAAAHALTSADESRLIVELSDELDQLVAIVRALGVLREVSPRTLDAVAAMGEILSSRIVTAALLHAGVPAEWVDARRAIVTNDDHTQAIPLMRETNAALRASVLPVLDAGRVPVLGGFVGATVEGRTTTLGRGGSDYSGALVGAGIGASEIQIWTDVDGMLTADPRIVRDAAPRAAALVCRSGGAGVLRREGAASQHHPSRHRARHPRSNSELAQAGRGGHAASPRIRCDQRHADRRARLRSVT